jgi:hypothetical protein
MENPLTEMKNDGFCTPEEAAGGPREAAEDPGDRIVLWERKDSILSCSLHVHDSLSASCDLGTKFRPWFKPIV